MKLHMFSLVDGIADVLSQGWTDLQSLVNAWITDVMCYSMLSSKVVLGCVMH